MLRRIVLRRIDRLERELGASMDYLRHMARVSLRALMKFGRLAPLANYRRALPALEANVARIAVNRVEDCGACVQIAVNIARQEGVPRDVIRAVLEERYDALAPELADVAHFATAVAAPGGDDPELRERIRQRMGEEAFVELCMAIAIGKAPATLKRGLGYATSCSAVRVEVA